MGNVNLNAVLVGVRMPNHVEPLQDSKALRQHLKILLIPVDVYVVVINMLLAMVIPWIMGNLMNQKRVRLKTGPIGHTLYQFLTRPLLAEGIKLTIFYNTK